MAKLDPAKWTDDQLEALERKMRREYEQAAREMRTKQEKALARYARELEAREKALDGTKEAMDAHKRWLASQAVGQEWMRKMVDQLAQAANGANQRAIDMLNNALPHIYAENAAMAAFQVDRALRADTGFTLVNEDAVRHLMGDGVEGQIIHEVPLTPEADRLAKGLQSIRKDIDSAKDIRWNRQQFTSAITQGILQGESIPNIVKRTTGIFGKNRAAATRAARTACTAAENGGRMNSFERAKRLGIDMEIEWCATLDERTRESHRELDGERIELGERFSNGLEYPGDPSGDPGEVYNCRCRANGRVVGFDGERGDWADDAVSERWARLPQGTTYEQWKAGKPVSRDESYENPWSRVSGGWMQNGAAETDTVANENGFSGIAEGKDILGTWQRRPDEYDFEIEDVMAAQGFDGKPRVVDADEFDRAVREANGGDGLIMQRVYSAPDQATLDAYRESLYDGKWYVECSERGALYGKGMYAAQSYGYEVSDGMREAMGFYRMLGESVGNSYSFVETMTLSPNARIANYADVSAEFNRYNDEAKRMAGIARDKALEKSKADSLETFVSQTFDGGKAEAAKTIIRNDLGIEAAEWDDLSAAHKALSADDEEKLSRLKMRYGRQAAYLESEAAKNAGEFEGAFEDVGSFAAAMGYDAIAADAGVGGSEIVVLNRTKLIIKEP